MNIGPVEAVWLALALGGMALTIWALVDAFRDLRAIVHLNGDVRSIVARGNVRREFVRLLIQVAYVSLPWLSGALFSAAEIPLSPFILVLMSLPALQLVNTASDYVGRVKIARRLLADIVAARLRSNP